MKGIIALNCLVIPRKDFMNVRGTLTVEITTEHFWDELARIRKSGVCSTSTDFMVAKEKLKEQEPYCIFYAEITNQDVVNVRVRSRNQKFTDAFRSVFETGYIKYDDWENLCEFVEENDYIMTATKFV